MAKRRSRRLPYRVVIADMFEDGLSFDLVRGIYDFKETSGRWQFAMRRGNVFCSARRLDGDKIDGVIGSFYETMWLDAIASQGVYAVNTSSYMQQSPLPRVGNDDEAAGRMGAAHLLEKGFAHLGFVGREDAWYSQRRLDGFRQAVETAGRSCHVISVPYDRAKRGKLIVDWLAALPKPIGIMATVDNFARHVLELALELNLRVPDDLAVVGVDNNRWVTELADPPISTVAPDNRQIGYRAAKLLDRLMAGEAAPPDVWVPPLGVIGRKSTDIVLADDALITRTLAYIREHFAEGIVVDDVLAELDVSRRSLERRMKQAIGQTPQVAIDRARINWAEHMLVNSDATMYQIAKACGFTRLARFFDAFKRHTGLTPGQYRRQRGLGQPTGRTSESYDRHVGRVRRGQHG